MDIPDTPGYAKLFRKMAVRTTLAYLVVGGGWILFSDHILSFFVTNIEALSTLQTVKGWAFILVTDLLLYALLLRNAASIEREEALRGESEQRFQDTFRAIPVSIWEVDLSGIHEELAILKRQRVTDLKQYFSINPLLIRRLMNRITIGVVNQRTLDILSADTQAQLLESLDQVFTPESEDVFREAVYAIAEGKDHFEADMEVVTLRGDYRSMHVSMAIPSSSDRLRSVPVSAVDISERKRTEQMLLLLQLAVEQIEEAVTITTAQLEYPGPQIVYVNPAFTRLTGYSAEEALGATPRILHGPKTERAVLDRLLQNLWQRQPFHGRTWNYRKDGTEFMMDWYVVPLVDRQFEVTHFVAVQREVTPCDGAERGGES